MGVEGTGSYGAELASAGIKVVEVDRADRPVRHRQGKSDAVDAIAVSPVGSVGQGEGKAQRAQWECRDHAGTRRRPRSARNHRIATLCQIRHLAFCAPDELRVQLTGVSTRQVVAKMAGLRPATSTDPVPKMTKRALRELGGRVKNLETEIERLTAEVEAFVRVTAPELVTLFGVGPHATSIPRSRESLFTTSTACTTTIGPKISSSGPSHSLRAFGRATPSSGRARLTIGTWVSAHLQRCSRFPLNIGGGGGNRTRVLRLLNGPSPSAAGS